MGYIWLIIAIVAQVAYAIFFKAGMLKVGQSPQNLRKLPRFLLRTISNPFVILGIIFFIAYVVFNSFALSILPLSYMFPLGMSIPLVSITISSSLWFKEKVSRLSWLGIMTICVGVIIFGVFQTGVNP